MRTCTLPTPMYFVVGLLHLGCDAHPGDNSGVEKLGDINAGGNVDAGSGCSEFVFPEGVSITSVPCPRDVCGVNGAWLGQHVAFRELALDGTPNAQNLRIKSFQSATNDPLQIHVSGDSLIGQSIDGYQLTGKQLIGAKLTLVEDTDVPPSQNSPSSQIYVFTIIDVKYPDFWADCTQSDFCPIKKTLLYRFIAKSGNGCDIQMCRPGINPPDGSRSGLAGDAVIFAGDLYDEDSLTVKVADLYSPDNPHGKFNISCLGTAISKLEMLRHTSASQGSLTPVGSRPDRDQRQALLRLLTGDYCGDGSLYTQNGIPIKLVFNNPLYRPTEASGYRYDFGGTVDAGWNGTRATCIGTPRWTEIDAESIKRACYRFSRQPLLDCADRETDAFFTSMNPPADAGVADASP